MADGRPVSAIYCEVSIYLLETVEVQDSCGSSTAERGETSCHLLTVRVKYMLPAAAAERLRRYGTYGYTVVYGIGT